MRKMQVKEFWRSQSKRIRKVNYRRALLWASNESGSLLRRMVGVLTSPVVVFTKSCDCEMFDITLHWMFTRTMQPNQKVSKP